MHYDQTNGLPGANGYNIFQDHNGYIWISTENGLARFNGYEFRVFTTKDGLPGNEVFNLNEDRYGRLWYAPFTNNIGYIKNEKIYHKGNDPQLRRLHFNNRPENILFDSSGNTFFCERGIVTCLNANGAIKQTNFFTDESITSPAYIAKSGVFTISNRGIVYQYYANHFIKTATVPVTIPRDKYALYHGVVCQIQYPEVSHFLDQLSESKHPIFSAKEVYFKYNTLVALSDGKIAILRKDGCYMWDKLTSRITDTLLYGENVGSIAETADKALWLGTQGKGIYRFANSSINKIDKVAPASYIKANAAGMYAVMGERDYIDVVLERDNNAIIRKSARIGKTEFLGDVKYLSKNKKGYWICCAAEMTVSHSLVEAPFVSLRAGNYKEVFVENDSMLLVGTSKLLLRVNKDKLTYSGIAATQYGKSIDELKKETCQRLFDKRITSITKIGNVVYAGSLDGIYAGNDSGSFKQAFTNIPQLSDQIVKLCAGNDGTLWVANNNGELIAVAGNKIVKVIGANDGLQCSRICALKVTNTYIWVATDNGLFAAINHPPYTVVRHLTHATGLNSNQINCLDVAGNIMWVGTSKGINYFHEQSIFQKMPARALSVNTITNGDNTILHAENAMTLSEKSLAIDFDLIDHYGGQRPRFEYRFGKDSNWTRLENSNLFFADVPYGYFTVGLRAVSLNWNKSSDLNLKFYRPYPFFLRWWFILIVSIVLLILIIFTSLFFLRRARAKDQEKLAIQRNLLQLEQLALQGQMNPHFIFNCITAIKQNYNSGDTERANTFVDVFTALIRQTFEMVVETFVSLDKELNYLSKYLLVEQARFDHSFDFRIVKNISLPEEDIAIPAMMLQPIVENAIRHGIRHLTGADRRGLITIEVTQTDESVEIILTDNGVGRSKSRQFAKFLQQMRLTSTVVNAKRIDVLNRLFNNRIIYRTDDIMDDDGQTVVGTRVTVSYPVDIQNQL